MVNDDTGFSEHTRRVEESLLVGEDEFGWRIDRGGAVRADRFVSLSMLSGVVSPSRREPGNGGMGNGGRICPLKWLLGTIVGLLYVRDVEVRREDWNVEAIKN